VADKAPTAADKVPTAMIEDEDVVIEFCLSRICFRVIIRRFRMLSRPERTQADRAERKIFISAASYHSSV
jgi:hypothetical protein